MNDSTIDIIKKNIKRLMDEKGIKQIELAEKTGIPQSRISAALALDKSTCFTAEQIVLLANTLNCTTDEILLPAAEKKKDKIETLSDVLEMLFEIDKFMNLNIDEFNINLPNKIDFTSFVPTSVPGFYVESAVFIKILNVWKKLKNNPLEEPLKNEIIQLWQNHVIEQYKDYKKEDFVNSCLKDFSDVPFH